MLAFEVSLCTENISVAVGTQLAAIKPPGDLTENAGGREGRESYGDCIICRHLAQHPISGLNFKNLFWSQLLN